MRVLQSGSDSTRARERKRVCIQNNYRLGGEYREWGWAGEDRDFVLKVKKKQKKQILFRNYYYETGSELCCCFNVFVWNYMNRKLIVLLSIFYVIETKAWLLPESTGEAAFNLDGFCMSAYQLRPAVKFFTKVFFLLSLCQKICT